MRNHAMKKRVNEKVKTQNDWSLHATLRNDRGGPKDSIFVCLFFFGDEEEEEQVDCTGIQSFPPSDIRPCMEECGEYACSYYDRKLPAHQCKTVKMPWERGCLKLGMGKVFGNDLVLAIVKQCLDLLCSKLQKAYFLDININRLKLYRAISSLCQSFYSEL